MLKRKATAFVVISLGLVISLVQPLMFSTASAVSTEQRLSSGITVSPAYITAQVGSAQRQATASVGVRNNFTVPITVTAVLNGFDIKNNSLLPTNRSESALADIIKFTPAEITIPAKSSRNIAVTVTDKASLAPGGHYVSLLITQTATPGTSSLPQLSLKPAVSATIYVIKEDGAVRSLQVKEIKHTGNLFSLPKKVDVEFYNNGNVASVPRGIVTIKRAGIETIYSQAVINSDSTPVYPKQSTVLRANFVDLVKPKFPSRLVATLDYRPNGQAETKTVSVSVWYIPPSSLLVGLFLLTILGLIAWPTSRRRMLRAVKSSQKPTRKPFVKPDIKSMPKKPENSSKPSTLKKRRIDIG